MVSRSLTRRQMLRGIAAGVGLLVGSSVVPLLRAFGGTVASTPELNHAAFAGLVGTPFRVEVSHSFSATIQLASVRSLTAQGVPPPTGEGFSLLFTGAERLPQGTYAVDHSSLGRFDMFLVPVGPAGPDQRYEAVFNRLWK